MKWQRVLPISTRRIREGSGRVLSADRRAAAADRRAGFTLVEMMVAVMVLAIGLLGLTSTAAYVVRQLSGGSQQTIASTVVQSRTEWMLARPCTSIKSDSTAVNRGVTEHWITGATVNRVLQVTDTVKYSLTGSKKSQTVKTFTLFIPCW